MDKVKYTSINNFVTPAYLYIEGNPHEEYWVDSQNLFYYMYLQQPDDKGNFELPKIAVNKETNLIGPEGKKWWIIEPVKPEGETITEDNYQDLVKYMVTECWDIDFDTYEHEWNFDKHGVD